MLHEGGYAMQKIRAWIGTLKPGMRTSEWTPVKELSLQTFVCQTVTVHTADYFFLVRASCLAGRRPRGPTPARLQGSSPELPSTPSLATKPITRVKSQESSAGEMLSWEGKKLYPEGNIAITYMPVTWARRLPLRLDFEGTWSNRLIYMTG